MAKASDPTIKIDRDLLEKLAKLCGAVPGQSYASLVKNCVEEMVRLIETEPENRQMPMLVRLVDASREGGGGCFGKPSTSERPKMTRPKSLRAKREEN